MELCEEPGLSEEPGLNWGVKAKCFIAGGTILGSYCGPQGILRGKEAKKFLEDEEKRRRNGQRMVHYWANDSGSDCLVFNGQYENDLWSNGRGEQPIHLGPFINHCDEGEPKQNVQELTIRVSSYCNIQL